MKASRLNMVEAMTPPGFVITTTGTAHLKSYIDSDGFRNGSLTSRILAGVRRLGCPLVSVRSSHIQEDSPSMSFAGMLASFIDVNASDEDAIMRAIKAVIESASGKRASAYAAVRGEVLQPAGIAVIVQTMVQPAASGVLLSSIRRHDKNWLLLEWVRGHLADLMNGVGIPSRAALCLADHACRDDVTTLSRILVPPPLPLRHHWHAVDQLGRLAFLYERRLGCHVAIEWAVDSASQLWILQVRPIPDERLSQESRSSRQSPPREPVDDLQHVV
jgi:pyruvate,water dikinase